MSSDTVYTSIREHLTAQWAGATPIRWENEAFTPPDGLEWISIDVAGTSYAQQTIGANDGNRWDEEGSLYIDVMAPAGTGSTEARRLAKRAADIFRGTLLLDDNLEFLDAVISRDFSGGGRDDSSVQEANWFVITVAVDWRLLEA